MTKEVLVLIIGVLVAEATEVAPWLALRLVRWAAHVRYLDTKRAAIRAEEWQALIEMRPGKLLKLATSLLFTLQAGAAWGSRMLIWIRLFGHVLRSLDNNSLSDRQAKSAADTPLHEQFRIWAKSNNSSGQSVSLVEHVVTTGFDVGLENMLVMDFKPHSRITQAASRVNRSSDPPSG
ncbi:hypothetical protein [Nonomuraea endophytica]|uniref:hypothetical protein n=1 Tax=Nonomuraea endophytica TaxID=714136 RepID=UPI0037C85B65